MGDGHLPNKTDFASTHHRKASINIYRQPLDSPGLVPVHQKQAVAVGLPILEILQRLLHRLQSGYSLDTVLALIAIYKAGVPVYKCLTHVFVYLFTSQVTVPEYDPVAKEILAWMSSEVMSKSRTTEAMILSSGDDSSFFGKENFYRHVGQRASAAQLSDDVQYMAPIGKKIFWIGFRPFLFYRSGGFTPTYMNQVWKNGPQQNALVLRTLGWSLQPLQNFIKTCTDVKLENKTGTTRIYFSGQIEGTWQSVTKAVRKLDTIDIDEEIKSDLIKDAYFYYSAEARRFYHDCGIPYRRGYLFHGPPGTGKTSFSAALAGRLNCDLYMINLATGDVSDKKLHRLFLALPKKCVVVIEDIDSAGIGREQDVIPQIPPLHLPRYPDERPRAKVTLSGLLNAIDGNASSEGRLLVMTSNNPDALDEALTRPGRIDKSVFFGNMSKLAATNIFVRLIGRTTFATSNYSPDQIADKAAEFSGKLPANVFTPAQVQNFLQYCRGDPDKAIQEVDAWVQKNAPKVAQAQQTNDVQGTTTPPPALAHAPAHAAAINAKLLNGSLGGDADLDVVPRRL
ncbi:P-loop containing nucleoside triphosphate hydrolase protein [Melanomma pulvis-pyrius CBS 109.77]|uniref:P-loop containing nucleoside triphosphate hydrolase protein n=1 Tax=Melanomma pulvis-pyrius CBS 109.77 TaxID=1314802 RepID=A0A6A6XG86_9PLEO|nr:P-loop containing nucleoside triphosphate hydrolase protein [Melanomma pulvis-pyrius CBS 109.77]